MTIRLLRTERIALDGVTVRFYREGDILTDVSLLLANALVRDGIATVDLKPAELGPEALPLAHTPKAQLKNPSRKREYKNN